MWDIQYHLHARRTSASARPPRSAPISNTAPSGGDLDLAHALRLVFTKFEPDEIWH